MEILLRTLISMLFIVTVGACDNARLSLVNAKGGGTPSTKPDCGENVSTIAVHDATDTLVGSLTPWQGTLSANDNYNYRGEAADVVIGPKGMPRHASHFFYNNADGLYLFFILDRFHNFKGDATVSVRVETAGNGLQDHVVFSDENREMRVVETNKTLELRTYRGTFEYQEFGDGAVIGPFHGSDWEVRVSYESASEIHSVQLADSRVGGMIYPLQEKNLQAMVFSPAVMGLCQLPKSTQ